MNSIRTAVTVFDMASPSLFSTMRFRKFHWRRSVCLSVLAGAVLLAGSAGAQTTNIAELRELRVSCLESFNTAKTRLDELHGFLDQQAGREHTAADQQFQMRQSAATAKRQHEELLLREAQLKANLEEVRSGINRATTSYRAAMDSLPNGEAWAAEGSVALNELRRAADAAPRDEWKHKRVKEVEEEFLTTLHEWRSARRSTEQVNFDLELRAAPGVFKRVANQIETVAGELKTLDGVLAERNSNLAAQAKESEKWGEAIRALRDGEAQPRKRLAEVAFQFHLVDLKFAAWRLKQSGSDEQALEALPDLLERSVDTTDIAGRAINSMNALEGPNTVVDSLLGGSHGADMTRFATEKEQVEMDAAFCDLLARVNLAEARLSFVSEVWAEEVGRVRKSIELLEGMEEKVRSLTDDTARLSADLEALRRSLESSRLTLTAGAETLDLVKKRSEKDLASIQHLLEDATAKTAKLAKTLER